MLEGVREREREKGNKRIKSKRRHCGGGSQGNVSQNHDGKKGTWITTTQKIRGILGKRGELERAPCDESDTLLTAGEASGKHINFGHSVEDNPLRGWFCDS